MSKEERIATVMNPIVKKLIEFSMKEKMVNPKFSVEATVEDGKVFRLVFERTDIDDFFKKHERSTVK